MPFEASEALVVRTRARNAPRGGRRPIVAFVVRQLLHRTCGMAGSRASRCRHGACSRRGMQRSTRTTKRGTKKRTALLLIDFMNPLDFDGAQSLAPRAVRAAACAAALKKRMRARRAPIIYANDNFGRWESDFHAVVDECKRRGGASARMANLLAPSDDDRSVLKPRHSAFFGTPLDFLLDELGVGELVLAGLAADSCIMFTAHDAYLRKYGLWIPADCVASEKDAWRRDALAYMARVLKARTDPAVP
jgi:nicotinamidase-related amidase